MLKSITTKCIKHDVLVWPWVSFAVPANVKEFAIGLSFVTNHVCDSTPSVKSCRIMYLTFLYWLGHRLYFFPRNLTHAYTISAIKLAMDQLQGFPGIGKWQL